MHDGICVHDTPGADSLSATIGLMAGGALVGAGLAAACAATLGLACAAAGAAADTTAATDLTSITAASTDLSDGLTAETTTTLDQTSPNTTSDSAPGGTTKTTDNAPTPETAPAQTTTAETTTAPAIALTTAQPAPIAEIGGGGSSGMRTSLPVQPASTGAAGTVQIFRNVDANEFNAIAATGRFGTAAGQMEGKWFATQGAHADRWGELLNGGDGLTIETTSRGRWALCRRGPA